jgi:hypothetical protein
MEAAGFTKVELIKVSLKYNKLILKRRFSDLHKL